MPEPLKSHIALLMEVNIRVRQQLELAEAQIGTVNALLAQLFATELINDQIFLGDIVLKRAYDVRADRADSPQMIQAVLSVGKGIGAVFWDMEELAQLSRSPELETEAIYKLVPFDQCGSAIKALLLPHAGPLLVRLLRSL